MVVETDFKIFSRHITDLVFLTPGDERLGLV